MEPDKKVEIIQKAIRKLMEEEEEEEEEGGGGGGGEEVNSRPGRRRRRQQLLSDLLSELEWMEEKVEGNCSKEEEIIKELKDIKRQNRSTHWLVSAMILFTLAWQLSEISLILKIKDGFRNPLKSFGGLIGGFIKKRHPQPQIPDMIKEIPEFPNLGLPSFDTSDNDDDDDD